MKTRTTTLGVALSALSAHAMPTPQGARLVHDAEYYLLEAQHGEMIKQFHVKSMFNRQLQRHLMWIDKYPNRPDATPGPALTGVENVRPETERLYSWPVDPAKLPFDPEDVYNHDLPFTESDL